MNHKMTEKKDLGLEGDGKIKVSLSYKSTLIHCINEQHTSMTQPFLHGLWFLQRKTITRATELTSRAQVTGTSHSLALVSTS